MLSQQEETEELWAQKDDEQFNISLQEKFSVGFALLGRLAVRFSGSLSINVRDFKVGGGGCIEAILEPKQLCQSYPLSQFSLRSFLGFSKTTIGSQ